jgi:Na+-transporting NADH:ubiquinone oxidoreductase subunit B
MQKPMMYVCTALAPLVFAAVYLFGWRAFALVLISLVFGIITESFFTFSEGKPVTSAVFVTCLIYGLSLPPTLPFWMAAAGVIFGVGLGKMAFGGLGQNVFNPAMVGRCFIYITFPIHMTNRWPEPVSGVLGGFTSWAAPDAVTGATPLAILYKGETLPFKNLLWGYTSGSIGETSAFLIIIGAAYIIYKKAAPWRMALSCLLGGITAALLFFPLNTASSFSSPLYVLFAGSFLFGAAFVVTEPISGAKTKQGQWVYGFAIGFLIIVLRRYSNFSEGLMFSVLLLNAFVPLIDQAFKKKRNLFSTASEKGKI